MPAESGSMLEKIQDLNKTHPVAKKRPFADNENIRHAYRLIHELAQDYVAINSYEKDYLSISPDLLDFSVHSLEVIDAHVQSTCYPCAWKKDYVKGHLGPALGGYLARTLLFNIPSLEFKYASTFLAHAFSLSQGNRHLNPFEYAIDVIYRGYRMIEAFRIARFYTLHDRILSCTIAPVDRAHLPAGPARTEAMEWLQSRLKPGIELRESHNRDSNESYSWVNRNDTCRVECPKCNQVDWLSRFWINPIFTAVWAQDANSAKNPLDQRTIDTPCCAQTVRLVDLRFDVPPQFSRYYLQLFKTRVWADFETLNEPPTISPKDVKALEKILGCKLATQSGISS